MIGGCIVSLLLFAFENYLPSKYFKETETEIVKKKTHEAIAKIQELKDLLQFADKHPRVRLF